jgi:hypothetical protein
MGGNRDPVRTDRRKTDSERISFSHTERITLNVSPDADTNGSGQGLENDPVNA